MNVVVYCGSSPGRNPVYIEEAGQLGAWIAARGHRLVYGGGEVGVMGALANAVLRGGGAVTGVIPTFLVAKEMVHRGLPELIVTADMHERKRRMLELGDCFIALPGGTGTLEEIAEAVSWAALALHDKPCIFFSSTGFYNHVAAFFDLMTAEGFVSPENRARTHFVSTLAELEKICH